MLVRERADGDLDGCERLARVVHQTDRYPPRLPGDLRAFVGSAGNLGAWVAEADGALVGHVALRHDSTPEVMALAASATGRTADELGVVARLLVDPAHRRQGHGRALLDAAAEAAWQAGRWPVLDVASQFISAVALYEAAGWTCAGRVEVRLRGTDPLEELVYLAPGAPSG